MQSKANQRPRRRPVARHPGIYYRPCPGGRVGPPYEIAYLDSTGRRRWQVVHGSLDDAEARRAELRLRRHRGERIEPTTQRFAEYALEWLERQSTRDRTREVHSWALRQHLIPYFGRRRIDQITVDDVAAFIVVLQDKGLRGSTANTALRSLSRILSHAARRGAIPINPCSQLERGERPKLNDTRPHRILSLDEMQAVLANSECTLYRCLLELLFTTGLRIGEALGLAVGDLDSDDCVIRVEYQFGRDGTRNPLKTEESRRAIDINHLSLDGVMQSPGRPDEDTRGGFTYGGWGSRNSDAEMLDVVYARVNESGGLRLLLGRWTYEEMLGYWNTQNSPFKDALNNAPKYVASRTLHEPLPWPNSTLLHGEAGAAVAEFKQKNEGDLFVMGSGELIETLMRRDLINEYLLVIHPLLLGTGRRMFTDGIPPASLRLIAHTTTARGVAIATYQPLGNEPGQTEAPTGRAPDTEAP